MIKKYPLDWQAEILINLVNRTGSIWANPSEYDSHVAYLNHHILDTLSQRMRGIVEIAKKLPDESKERISSEARRCLSELEASIMKSKIHDKLCKEIIVRMNKISTLLSDNAHHPSYEHSHTYRRKFEEMLRDAIQHTDVGFFMLRGQQDEIAKKRMVAHALEEIALAISKKVGIHT